MRTTATIQRTAAIRLGVAKLKIIERFMDRKRHPFHLRQLGGNPYCGKNDINGKNDKIDTGGRSGTNEYSFLEPPSHFANVFASQSIVFWFVIEFRVQTSAIVVHATQGEDRTRHRTHNRRTFFSCARHFINAYAFAQDELSIRVCIVSKVILSSLVSFQLARCDHPPLFPTTLVTESGTTCADPWGWCMLWPNG